MTQTVNSKNSEASTKTLGQVNKSSESNESLPDVQKNIVNEPNKNLGSKSYLVAEGRAITSKKGILKAGDEVKSSYFFNGKETIESFMKTGHIIKV